MFCVTSNTNIQSVGVKSDFYHADLGGQKRKEVQERWMNNQFDVICTTIAFGLGIDKPDIRYIIHHTMPTSLEAYYQQTGRAVKNKEFGFLSIFFKGRDGKPSTCILFYKPSDRNRIEKVITPIENIDVALMVSKMNKSIDFLLGGKDG
jgi:superfamily II DNA helicase RecQ